MKKIRYKKNIVFELIITGVFFVFCHTSQGQVNNNKPTVDKKFVRIDIGHGALHCPFLSPKLEAKLKDIKNIDNFFIDKRESYATFNLPSDTELTAESLKKIGTDVGYPANDVVVTMDSKPIKPAIIKQ